MQIQMCYSPAQNHSVSPHYFWVSLGLNPTCDLPSPASPSHPLCISFSPSSLEDSSTPEKPYMYWDTFPLYRVKDNASIFSYVLGTIFVFSCHMAPSVPLSRITLWLLWLLCWQEMPVNLSSPPTGAFNQWL